MSSELWRQVRILDSVSSSDRIADVLITDGVIQEVAAPISDYPPGTEIQDGAGLVLGTGLVDLYSHSGEPGFESRETWDSLKQAATAGGFTRLNILPDTQPTVDRPSHLTLWERRYAEESHRVSASFPHKDTSPQIRGWGAITQKLQGEQMTELAEMAAAGVVGFTDGQPIRDLLLLQRVLEYVKPLDKPIALRASDRQLASQGVIREGSIALRLGLPINPTISETTSLAAILEVVAVVGTPVHIMQVSTGRGVELIRQAKTQGLPITASTTWMHLLLDSQDLCSYNPNLRLEPPLGNPQDRIELIAGVRSGIIDAIAIDHAPYTYEEKTVAFTDAPPGAIGLELALPLLWQAFVATGQWSGLELWQRLSSFPARCLGQQLSAITPGNPAELTLFAPKAAWSVNSQTIHSLSTNTPWWGQELTGRVLKTWNPRT
ncbi:dihydroorotase [Merismopedia glauca]|uniref:Dihydroorotase n=1 Tax=Merismopedia glauca CCAP 1448/3 TaxID=1296344 RepID=A0A2T1C8P1_9CYAN|nr:dihydroorotase [Merismopedia glauca]PSB04652.1 dihydroorotase [Merismopedia glauca CCAP 1448/3]